MRKIWLEASIDDAEIYIISNIYQLNTTNKTYIELPKRNRYKLLKYLEDNLLNFYNLFK